MGRLDVSRMGVAKNLDMNGFRRRSIEALCREAA